MYPPIDYPIHKESHSSPITGEITYANLLDRFATEQEITEDMIQSACLSLEAAQQFPFVANSEPFHNEPTLPIITRLFKVLR